MEKVFLLQYTIITKIEDLKVEKVKRTKLDYNRGDTKKKTKNKQKIFKK